MIDEQQRQWIKQITEITEKRKKDLYYSKVLKQWIQLVRFETIHDEVHIEYIDSVCDRKKYPLFDIEKLGSFLNSIKKKEEMELKLTFCVKKDKRKKQGDLASIWLGNRPQIVFPKELCERDGLKAGMGFDVAYDVDSNIYVFKNEESDIRTSVPSNSNAGKICLSCNSLIEQGFKFTSSDYAIEQFTWKDNEKKDKGQEYVIIKEGYKLTPVVVEEYGKEK